MNKVPERKDSKLPKLSPQIFRSLVAAGKSSTGQITIGSQFGTKLYSLALQPEVQVVLEIGSWEGNGSTRVFREATRNRPEASIIGIEVDENRARRAKRRNRKFPNVEILWGSFISLDDLDASDLLGDERLWLEQDIAAMRNSPRLMPPLSVDLLLLDGGEFSTYAEWQLLSPCVTTWLALDDTRTRKSKRIAEEIRSGQTPFEVFWETGERNGALIARRIT